MNANISPTLQASSAVRKSGMSITLPRNFAPLSLDRGSLEPRTPDQTFAEISLPPPPPHSTYRIRRPRVNLDSFQTRNNALPSTLFASEVQMPSSISLPRVNYSLSPSVFNSDETLPSIETPTGSAVRPPLQSSNSAPLFTGGLSVPMIPEQLPRTPPAQTNMTTPEIKRSKWEMHRAGSVCSHHSDSSLSSNGTYATRPTSFDGSATSPDCDNQDPFSPTILSSTAFSPTLASPQVVKIIPDTPTRKNKKLRQRFSFSKDNVDWSIEMDNHLFNIYQMYLADPTVTPFKTVPGSIPPTGVCHRVARKARDTWPRASRIDVPIIKRYKVRNLLDVKRAAARDKTPEPDNFLRTDDMSSYSDGRAPWPSESSTRRRLKELCREKFTVTAHYQRLRQSRSPSPFAEQFTRRPSSRLGRSVTPSFDEADKTGTYTTRELGISLVANDATAPLARIVSEDHTPMVQLSDNWFSTPNDAPEPMNLSTPSAAEPTVPEPQMLAPLAAKIPRLASPFNYSTWNGASNRNPHRRHVSHGQFGTMHATGARLLSPFCPEQDVPIKIHKRRAQHNLEDELSLSGSNIGESNPEPMEASIFDVPALQTQPSVEQDFIFTGTGDIGQRRIRLRNRGVSLGAPVSGMDRIGRLFTPPPPMPSDIPPVPALPAFLSNITSDAPKSAVNSLAVPELDPNQRRLGSPFELDPNKRSIRNRSPRHGPSMSDPFISTSQFSATPISADAPGHQGHSNSISGIGERLALFNSLHRLDETPQ